MPADRPTDEDSAYLFEVCGPAVRISRGRPRRAEAAHFIGQCHGLPCWAEACEGGDGFVDLRTLFPQVDELLWRVAGRAVQVVAWAHDHRYCGRCGQPTVPVAGERAARCEGCRLDAYPRLSPAVIVVVDRDDEVLLARNHAFPPGLYSALAGFVEPGETLEEAAIREVGEEVGVEIDDLEYVGSGPWPFPNSLMIGFLARWRSGAIQLDEGELADARWFPKDELPLTPGPISIARRLIDLAVARGRVGAAT